MSQRRSVDIDAAAWLRGEIRAGRLTRSLSFNQLRDVARIVKTATPPKKESNGRDKVGFVSTGRRNDANGTSVRKT